MPNPEFVSLPEFLKFHCTNTDSERCTTCPRDFAIQANMIQGVYKDSIGKALMLIESINYCPTPVCGDKCKFIQTNISWDDALLILDGKLTTIGDIKLIEQDHIRKG